VLDSKLELEVKWKLLITCPAAVEYHQP
jgi:hypothetical protein